MKTKVKLQLKTLKVQSFVTLLGEDRTYARGAGLDTKVALICVKSLACAPSQGQPCFSMGADVCSFDSC